jgi:hypothetical protein
VTEELYHSFWDANIRNIVELLVPEGKCIRNSNKHTATRQLRPDYGHILNQRCPYRGEEEPPGGKGDPKDELAQKLVWDHDPVPYLLGKSHVHDSGTGLQLFFHDKATTARAQI